MAKLKIVRFGDPCLRVRAKEVTKVSKKIKHLCEDMLETMYAVDGVGLAAPQVGEALRVFVIDTSDPNGPRNPRAYINPKIIKKSGAMISREGCLSFPDLNTNVRRYQSVTVKAINLDGRPFITEAKEWGLLSKALQHEIDHLDGVLFVDRARNLLETGELLSQCGLPPLEAECVIKDEELECEIMEKITQGAQMEGQ
jgi:peptide deformylase